MDKKLYGQTFRKLRIQKQLTLSDFERLGIGKSNLSKFERGKTMMSFDRVYKLLEVINVSLEEYELMLNNFVVSFQEEFFTELEEADFRQDHARLQKLHEEARSEIFLWSILAVKSCLEKLSEEEKERISHFLMSLNSWGYVELCIAYFVLDNLGTANIRKLLQNIEEWNPNTYRSFKYRRKILQISYRASTVFSARGKRELAYTILEKTGQYYSGQDIYLAILREFVEGFYLYQFGDRREGNRKIYRSLDLFEELNSSFLRTYYQKRFEILKLMK